MTDVEKRLRAELARLSVAMKTGTEAEQAYLGRKAGEVRQALAGWMGPEYRNTNKGKLYVVKGAGIERAVRAEDVADSHKHRASLGGQPTGGVWYKAEDVDALAVAEGLAIDPETTLRGQTLGIANLRAEIESLGAEVHTATERTRWAKNRTGGKVAHVLDLVKALTAKAAKDEGWALVRYQTNRARWMVRQTVEGLQKPTIEERESIGVRLAAGVLKATGETLDRAQARLSEMLSRVKTLKAQRKAAKELRKAQGHETGTTKARVTMAKAGKVITHTHQTVLQTAGYANGLL